MDKNVEDSCGLQFTNFDLTNLTWEQRQFQFTFFAFDGHIRRTNSRVQFPLFTETRLTKILG